MGYGIEVVELKPQPVLVMEAVAAPPELGDVLAGILPMVHAFAESHGASITGMPFLRYLAMTDRFTIEAGMPVAETIDSEGEVQCRELPGGRAATTVFLGPYDRVGDAWDALYGWCDERGIERRFGGWDVYENDPTGIDDPKDYRTRLYLPLP
ncbi:MAG: GyrI-like domain-containing protein [Pseudomonadales bacterium]